MPASPNDGFISDNTQLLPNYPNPFNPETWIPYQLASSSDVQITIYNMKGSVIRTLALGHQSAGYYTGRSRAAYWDGRNTFRGTGCEWCLRFYQLQADEIHSCERWLFEVTSLDLDSVQPRHHLLDSAYIARKY